MDILSKIIDFFVYADKLPLAVNIILFIAVRILLCIAVYKSALRKKLSESHAYAGLTAVFGIVGYIVFVLITSKLRDKEKKGRGTALIVISVILLCANIALLSYTYEGSKLNYKIEYYGFDSDVGIFEAENGDKIRYNNLGQGFSLKNMDAFFYQGEDGERYKYDFVKDAIDDSIYAEEFYEGVGIPDYCFNSKGDFCQLNVQGNYISIHINDNLSVIIDGNGELYYYLENCYFDKNGNFVFTDKILYNLTYDTAVKYLQEYDEYNYEYIYKNDNGLYVYYDKLGNEYSICDNRDKFKYQEKSGRVYIMDSELAPLLLVDENDEEYMEGFVDEDGYICFLPEDDFFCCSVSSHSGDMYDIYYDSQGNLYYPTYICFWDKNGNLKLPKDVADVTYEQVKAMASAEDEETTENY